MENRRPNNPNDRRNGPRPNNPNFRPSFSMNHSSYSGPSGQSYFQSPGRNSFGSFPGQSYPRPNQMFSPPGQYGAYRSPMNNFTSYHGSRTPGPQRYNNYGGGGGDRRSSQNFQRGGPNKNLYQNQNFKGGKGKFNNANKSAVKKLDVEETQAQQESVVVNKAKTTVADDIKSSLNKSLNDLIENPTVDNADGQCLAKSNEESNFEEDGSVTNTPPKVLNKSFNNSPSSFKKSPALNRSLHNKSFNKNSSPVLNKSISNNSPLNKSRNSPKSPALNKSLNKSVNSSLNKTSESLENAFEVSHSSSIASPLDDVNRRIITRIEQEPCESTEEEHCSVEISNDDVFMSNDSAKIQAAIEEENSVKTEDENVQNEMENVKTEDKNVQNDIENVKTEDENVQNEIENVKTEVENVQTEIENVNTEEINNDGVDVKMDEDEENKEVPAEDLNENLGLNEWLMQKGKDISEFQNLKAYDDENKENYETRGKFQRSDSYEALNIQVKDTKEDEELNKSTPLQALEELHKLILEGYPLEKCESWLHKIHQKQSSISEEPLFWECRAAVERDRGNFSQAVECYKTAIEKGAEVQAVDESLDHLLKTFDLLEINPDEPSSSSSSTKKHSNKNVLLDARNVFKSSVIQFAVTKRNMKKEQGDGPSKEFVVTPVRRSSRLASKSSTPGVKVCSTLDEVDENVKKNMTFKGNKLLL